MASLLQDDNNPVCLWSAVANLTLNILYHASHPENCLASRFSSSLLFSLDAHFLLYCLLVLLPEESKGEVGISTHAHFKCMNHDFYFLYSDVLTAGALPFSGLANS